jgi:hypothetical protein
MKMDKEELTADLMSLEKKLFDEKDRNPDRSIDQLILSAAHREIKKPKKRLILKRTGWRKLLLPLYVATGFAFTFIPVMFLWQAPAYHAENEDVQPTRLVYEQSQSQPQVAKENNSLINDYPSVRKLPVLVETPTNAERTVAEKIMTNFNLAEIQNIQGDNYKPKVFTGAKLKKALYPEKEAWVRRIVLLLKEDNIEQARLELIQFKRINPDYPIEEQIKMLTL